MPGVLLHFSMYHLRGFCPKTFFFRASDCTLGRFRRSGPLKVSVHVSRLRHRTMSMNPNGIRLIMPAKIIVPLR